MKLIGYFVIYITKLNIYITKNNKMCLHYIHLIYILYKYIIYIIIYKNVHYKNINIYNIYYKVKKKKH